MKRLTLISLSLLPHLALASISGDLSNAINKSIENSSELTKLQVSFMPSYSDCNLTSSDNPELPEGKIFCPIADKDKKVLKAIEYTYGRYDFIFINDFAEGYTVSLRTNIDSPEYLPEYSLKVAKTGKTLNSLSLECSDSYGSLIDCGGDVTIEGPLNADYTSTKEAEVANHLSNIDATLNTLLEGAKSDAISVSRQIINTETENIKTQVESSNSQQEKNYQEVQDKFLTTIEQQTQTFSQLIAEMRGADLTNANTLAELSAKAESLRQKIGLDKTAFDQAIASLLLDLGSKISIEDANKRFKSMNKPRFPNTPDCGFGYDAIIKDNAWACVIAPGEAIGVAEVRDNVVTKSINMGPMTRPDKEPTTNIEYFHFPIPDGFTADNIIHFGTPTNRGVTYNVNTWISGNKIVVALTYPTFYKEYPYGQGFIVEVYPKHNEN